MNISNSFNGDYMIFTQKKLLFFLLCIMSVTAVFLALNHRAIPSFSGSRPYTVVLDAGHGTPDGGAVGVSGTEEKDINLSIVLKIREILENRGVRVILTREDDNAICDDTAATIHEMKVSDMHNRLNIINNSNADLFISVHMNSFPSEKSNGLHIFYSRNHPEAQAIAELMQGNISAITGAKSHAVKIASDTLFLMKNPKPPAILAECGFISNPREEKLLCDEVYQSKIAFAIANAVIWSENQ